MTSAPAGQRLPAVDYLTDIAGVELHAVAAPTAFRSAAIIVGAAAEKGVEHDVAAAGPRGRVPLGYSIGTSRSRRCSGSLRTIARRATAISSGATRRRCADSPAPAAAPQDSDRHAGRPINFSAKSRTQPRFGFDRLALDINLGQRDEPSTSRVPADHLLRKIDGVLDLSELRHELAPFYR